MNQPIYLDNSLTSKPAERAVAEMAPLFSRYWGDPAAPHAKGQELLPYIKQAYRKLYDFLEVSDQDQLIVTSSGVEAVNQAIYSAYENRREGCNNFVTTLAEESASIMAMQHLKDKGCSVSYVELDNEGMVTPEALEKALLPQTVLVSIAAVNGLTGVMQPVEELAEVCRRHGVLLHVDLSHALGRVHLDFDEWQPDFLSFHGDNIHAPRGTGVLLVREGVHVHPLIRGGLEQDGLRAGTFNVPGVIALGSAAKEMQERSDMISMEIARLRDKLEAGVSGEVLFSDSERAPHISCISFKGINSEALLFSLNRRGLYGSIGEGRFQQLNKILKGCGSDEIIAHSAISFSLSRYTTEEEIDKALLIINEEVERLRNIGGELS
ncbi:MAG: cysteine desulfurase family protein [Chlamydiota bacterium]